MDMEPTNSTQPRELHAVALAPIQGSRFQPTGFPDLGAATYQLPDGSDCLLVESPQSVANRLESVCWDDARQDLVPDLAGLPYIRVNTGGEFLTSSILEAHRVNSPYILKASKGQVMTELGHDLGTTQAGPVDISKLARWCLRNDPNALLHGLFLAQKEIAGGRYRLKRLLSGFIEAVDVRPVNSGGVKNDRVNPQGDTRTGFGNVPYQRQEFAAGRITAYFNLDLATLRSYRLSTGADATESLPTCLLQTLAQWKIRRFLESGLRLRTACDLAVERPEAIDLPPMAELNAQMQDVIARCATAGLFASPAARTLDLPQSEIKVKKEATAEGGE